MKRLNLNTIELNDPLVIGTRRYDYINGAQSMYYSNHALFNESELIDACSGDFYKKNKKTNNWEFVKSVRAEILYDDYDFKIIKGLGKFDEHAVFICFRKPGTDEFLKTWALDVEYLTNILNLRDILLFNNISDLHVLEVNHRLMIIFERLYNLSKNKKNPTKEDLTWLEADCNNLKLDIEDYYKKLNQRHSCLDYNFMVYFLYFVYAMVSEVNKRNSKAKALVKLIAITQTLYLGWSPAEVAEWSKKGNPIWNIFNFLIDNKQLSEQFNSNYKILLLIGNKYKNYVGKMMDNFDSGKIDESIKLFSQLKIEEASRKVNPIFDIETSEYMLFINVNDLLKYEIN